MGEMYAVRGNRRARPGAYPAGLSFDWQHLALAFVLIGGSVASAQVVTNPPAKWISNSFIMGRSLDISRVELPHNSPEAVRAEILDPALLQAIAAASELSTQEINGLKLAKNPENSLVELYQVDAGLRAFNVMGDRLRAYVDGRKEGHTREYMFAAMTNRSILHLSQPDTDLQILLLAHPMIPEALVKKYASGTHTNRAVRARGQPYDESPGTNTISRWTAYCVIDGPVAWGYYLYFNPDGSYDHLEEVKCDARELDANSAPMLKAVDAQVEAQMKREQTYGRSGSLHTFWRLRKQRLKERGIDWRSPAELNPNIRYE